ncbi:LLM class F420-dependent oxidoreductase [Streptomyces sp. HC44]|uniref:LLM class F420-dependent oxidoreductase n=1 Tax=Streptomyces scabichelini TaxID=2711217 RepID=A0A6G4VFG8_9ACTN|nr:LLM class F420-dependent oxidoreductase [Streptomyces scabichelini]NGO12554.1 LLM class F420-dependent oxidoreductase [Streptomyces scabichelini]
MDVGIILLFDGQPGNTLADAGETARRIESMGFAHLWLPDHIVLFERYAPNYPYSSDGLPPLGPRQGWYDPLFGLAAAAGTTTRLRLGTNVLILPQRNPLLLAKQIVALDHLSAGRVDVGVGLGWSPEEYAALGVPYERRGARADEYIAAMTRIWKDELAAYEGEFISFSDVVALPKPVQQPRPPVLVGGQSPPALRRAARHGDGWISWMLPAEEISPTVGRLENACAAVGRDPAHVRRIHGFTYTAPEAFQTYADAARAAGADEIAVLPWVPDRDPGDVIAEIANLSAAMGAAMSK